MKPKDKTIKIKHKWYPYKPNDPNDSWYYKQYGKKARRCMVCKEDNFSKEYINPYTGSFVEGITKFCKGANL